MVESLKTIHAALGITETHLQENRLSLQCEPDLDDLRVTDIDFEGKPFVLASVSARSWIRMKKAALEEDIFLLPFSGFRSYIHQKDLIDRHLKNGPKGNTLGIIYEPWHWFYVGN